MGTLKDPVRIAKKARKFAYRDGDRPILSGVHLDECGDVVATDSYRMFIEHGAWDGPSIDLPAETLAELAKRKLKGNDTATIAYESGGEVVKTELSGGEKFVDSHPGGKFPNYKALCGGEVNTIAYVKTKELLPIVREHVKLNQPMLIDVTERDLRVRGVGEEPLPEYKVEKACDGADNEVTLDAKFLRDALSICGEVAEIRIESHIKPVAIVDGNTEIIVMPVRMTPTKAITKKAEPKPMERKPPTSTTNDELARSIYRIALDRAASDPDGRVQGGNASSYDRNLIFEHERSGQLTKLECGDYTSWYRDGEFVTCIERRWNKRKIHLTYPELKPKAHKVDKAAELKAKRAAREKTGAEVKATVTEQADVTAITIEKKEDDMTNKRIEELEAALAEAKAEAEAAKAREKAWQRKAEEYFAASKPAPEPKPEPLNDADTVSLSALAEQMQAWCAERKNVSAYRKNEQLVTPVRVEGDTKPYEAELNELGFRFAKKGFWYYGERQAAAQGKRVVA